MKAYKCDACGKLYLLPYDPKEETYAEIPMKIIMNEDPVSYRTMDICKDCESKIIQLIWQIQDPDHPMHMDFN